MDFDSIKDIVLTKNFIIIFIIVYVILYLVISLIKFIGNTPILILLTGFISYLVYNKMYMNTQIDLSKLSGISMDKLKELQNLYSNHS